MYTIHPDGFEKAYEEAAREAAVCLKAGILVFSPITHSHPISTIGGIDNEVGYNIWLGLDAVFLRAAKGLIICKMPNWEKSKGIFAEKVAMIALNKPIVYMTPGIAPVLP